jgi:hypothetical protein
VYDRIGEGETRYIDNYSNQEIVRSISLSPKTVRLRYMMTDTSYRERVEYSLITAYLLEFIGKNGNNDPKYGGALEKMALIEHIWRIEL